MSACNSLLAACSQAPWQNVKQFDTSMDLDTLIYIGMLQTGLRHCLWISVHMHGCFLGCLVYMWSFLHSGAHFVLSQRRISYHIMRLGTSPLIYHWSVTLNLHIITLLARGLLLSVGFGGRWSEKCFMKLFF